MRHYRTVFGRRVETVFRITEYEVNRRFSAEGTARSMAPFMLTTIFEPLGRNTRVTTSFRFEPRGLLRFAAPLVGGLTRRGLRANFARAKAILERD